MNVNKLHLNDPSFYRHIKNLLEPDSVTKSVSDDLIDAITLPLDSDFYIRPRL